eukprot:gene7259-20962_t
MLGSLFFASLTASALALCPSTIGPGEHLQTVVVGGVERTFYVYVPKGLGERASPGVVMLHGCGSSPDKFEMESQMNVRAETDGYYNIYMKGTGSNQLGWNAGFSQCTTGGAVNDVDFTRAVALWMLENLCVDPARLFAAGFSNGGSMTFNLTCTMSDTFAGFSFVGSTQPPSTYPSEPTCGRDGKPVKPMLGLCGKLDGCGNTIESWFNEFGRFSGCTGKAVETKVSTTSTCWKFSNCGKGKDGPLEYCMVDNLGHCWSGNDCCDSQCSNQDPNNLDFSKHVLDFFTGIPRSKLAVNGTAMIRSLRKKLDAAVKQTLL